MIFQYPPLNLQTHPPSISFFLLLKMLMLTPVPIKVIPLSSQGPQRVELISSTLYLQPSPLWRHIWSDLNLLKPPLFVYNTVHTHGHMHTHTHTHTQLPSKFPVNYLSLPSTHLTPHLHINLLKCIIHPGCLYIFSYTFFSPMQFLFDATILLSCPS